MVEQDSSLHAALISYFSLPLVCPMKTSGEMNEGKCEECSKWEHNMYWNQFRTTHFCQILDGDFRSQLMIPKKFSEKALGKLQDKVALEGPSGNGRWAVGLTAAEDNVFLRDGWGNFVEAFSLQENDILIFKYNGNSCFSMLIFDQGSLCEKESAYFIKKCSHSKTCHSIEDKGRLKHGPVEIIEEFPNQGFDPTPLKKAKKNGVDINSVAQDCNVSLLVTEMKLPRPDDCPTEEGPNNQKRTWTTEAVELIPVAETQNSPTTEGGEEVVKYLSKRRPVAEDLKSRALRMARNKLTADGFLVVIKPSHIVKSFLTIPANWMAAHLTFKKQVVRLRTKEKTWPTRFLCFATGRGGLSFGWKAFCLDNNLKEHDVCVFKLASKKHEPVVLDISLFQVAQ